jgi:hypothetical protein
VTVWDSNQVRRLSCLPEGEAPCDAPTDQKSSDTYAGPMEQGATRTKTLQPMLLPTWLVRKQAKLASFTHLMDDANAVPGT